MDQSAINYNTFVIFIEKIFFFSFFELIELGQDKLGDIVLVSLFEISRVKYTQKKSVVVTSHLL